MATITWSISVEEQIYLIFPFVLLLLKNRKFSLASYFLICSGLISRYIVIFVLHMNPYRNTLCYLDVVGIGLLVAIHEESILTKFKGSKLWALLITVLLIAYIFTFDSYNLTESGMLLGFFLTSLFVPALLIVCQSLELESRANFTLLGFLIFIGRRSYGCYLFHWMFWQIMVGRQLAFTPSKGFSIFGVFLGFGATVVLSAFSYRYFERPFLKMRHQFKKVLSP